MPVTRDRTERLHGASLQLDIECLLIMYRIGRSLRKVDVSLPGGVGGILPLMNDHSNPRIDYGRQCQVGSLTGAVAS